MSTARPPATATHRIAAITGSHPLHLAPRSVGGGRAAAFLGIVLISLNLRAAATSVPPILRLIAESFPVGATAQSILGTLPLLCFALFGFVTPRLTRWLGLERAMVLAAALIALGEITRAAFSQSAPGFILFSALCFGGMGMSNVLVPAAVKHWFPDRIGLISGVFQVLIVVSASLPSLIAVPAAQAVGWRWFVGSWSVLAILAALPWLALGRSKAEPAAADTAPGLLRHPQAWAVMVVFSTGPMLLYAMIAWLPTMLTQTRGISAATAAAMLSAFNAIGLIHSFVVPNVLGRMKQPYLVIVLAAVCAAAGPLGLAYAPGSAWPWVLISGVAALTMNVGLTLVTLRCQTEAGVTALSGFVQSAGYLIAAVAPLAMGALHTMTGGWVAPCWFLAAIGGLALIAGIPATRAGYLDSPEGDVS
ncbi:MFS transporter [Paracoccus sp. 22332]|uniref:MFS transporter n=1 Tax=Paracoccus sp. 22332 TaxID=3453913 RepID=UPI003F861CCB